MAEENCIHENFHTEAKVHRLEDTTGIVRDYLLDIKVHCLSCGQPFEFIGKNLGMSFVEPMISADLEELRAPIRPAEHPSLWYPTIKQKT